MAPSPRRPPGGTKVGSFTLEVRVQDKAMREALRKVRKEVNSDAKTAMLDAANDHLPAIQQRVKEGPKRGGNMARRLVVRAAAGQYPYLTASGRQGKYLGILEYGGTRRDIVYGKPFTVNARLTATGVQGRRTKRRVLWSGTRRHPRRMYVNKALASQEDRIGDAVREALVKVIQGYVDRASSSLREATD